MVSLKATEVFTPGAYPAHTYVERLQGTLEARLRDGIETPGNVVSLSGPSKSGKTVLVERVVGMDDLITVTGAGIDDPDAVWDRVLDWMESPSETSRGVTVEGSINAGAEASGSVGIPLVARGEVGASLGASVGAARAGSKVYKRRGLAQVVEEIGGSSFVVLIDDFHYMARNVQEEVAKQLKEAVRQGVKIITAAVPHRSDDVVRANPELRGRVITLDLTSWTVDNLVAIADKGFGLLNVILDRSAVKELALEAAGSPQLMQALCLNMCFELNTREKAPIPQAKTVGAAERAAVYERTAQATNFRSLVDVLDSGPKTRGTERKTYPFRDGSNGDVYRCVLKAVAADPPKLSFKYDDLLDRAHRICNGEPPVGSSVIGSCTHMSKLAQEKFPRERVLDWDEQKLVLDIPDPYLLFYLRWSGRLMEPEA